MKDLLPDEMEALRVLILDDEPDACRNLNILLEKYCSRKISRIYQTTSTLTAEQLIKNVQPHIVFLDIEMPAENGFQFLGRITERNTFFTVFVTAYDEYAIRAIKINALDYILKPVCEDELITAVDRVWHLVNKLSEEVRDVELALPSLDKEPEEMVLRTRTQAISVHFSNILFLEAEGSYSRFHYFDGPGVSKFLASHGLQHYQDILPPEQFFRAHKSYLINLKNISANVVPGAYEVTMADGSVVPLSRRRYDLLCSLLEKNS